jgi:glycosyltransferase involved in cell wall biosynthesis
MATLPGDVVRFYAAGQNGCGWYRCVQPAAALAAAGVPCGVSYRIVGGTSLAPDRPRIVPQETGDARRLPAIPPTFIRETAPVVVFQRPMTPLVGQMVELAAREGRRVIVELDDDMWSIAPHNETARAVGRAELAILERSCRVAGAVIVSTAALAAVVARRTGQRRIAVIPNAIDPALAVAPGRPVAPTVVGWAGSSSHRADFRAAVPALAEAARRPGVVVRLAGYDGLQGTAVPHEFLPWTASIPAHYANVATFDIALAPLEGGRFNAAKSAVKWMESALFATPMVLSDVGPYAGAEVGPGAALKAAGPADFAKQLRRLLADPGLRAQIGGAARADVLARHTIDRRIPAYREVLCA